MSYDKTSDSDVTLKKKETNADIGAALGRQRPVPGPQWQPKWPSAPWPLGGPSFTINKGHPQLTDPSTGERG